MKLTTNNMFPREQLTKLINKLSNDNNKQRKEIHRLSQMNKAYADYFAKNNIDFSYNNGVVMITKNVVKDDKQYLNDLEMAYADCDLSSIY